MKIPNKREPQQIAINYLSVIGFKGFMKIYKKCIAKLYTFLANDTTFLSDNVVCFIQNLLEKDLIRNSL